jgi:hypothetical protein
MGDTGLEPVTSALSNRPGAPTTTTYAAESACLLGFSGASDFGAPHCPASFVGRMWEDLWDSGPPQRALLRQRCPQTGASCASCTLSA